MATVTISENTYQRLQKAAQNLDLPIEQLIDRIASEAIGERAFVPLKPKPGTREWMNAFDSWISGHLASNLIADDSRDSVYGEERE